MQKACILGSLAMYAGEAGMAKDCTAVITV